MNTIVTIGRQFGSGGREIGENLAKRFQIPYYDRELLTRAARESGFCEEMIQNHDERPTNSFLYNLVMDTYSFGYNSSSFVDMPISHKVFLAQFDTIKKIADEGPCVIVGRCADYALEDYPNCLKIFIHADEAHKLARIMKRQNVDEGKA
ncbi:MAG: cytidylate kinase-like family protein, partial [Lachnospiraceae bacterium]|nr:cytidylate kinase-like family protein [Lachnospiraceae bacterium]